MNSSLHRLGHRLAAVLMAVAMWSCAAPRQSAIESSDSHDRTDLEGRSLEFAFERLGRNTILDETTPASELGGEFYTPVNERYPPDSPRSRKVLIREVRWQRGDYTIAALSVWKYGRWHVFDAVEWHKDLRF